MKLLLALLIVVLVAIAVNRVLGTHAPGFPPDQLRKGR